MESIKKYFRRKGVRFEECNSTRGKTVLFVDADYSPLVFPYIKKYHKNTLNWDYTDYNRRGSLIIIYEK